MSDIDTVVTCRPSRYCSKCGTNRPTVKGLRKMRPGMLVCRAERACRGRRTGK